MVTTADFVNIDWPLTETGKQRLAELISRLPDYPHEVRKKLVSGFMEISADTTETYGRRIQAASMLAFQNERLGIRGSASLSEAVCRVLEREFDRMLQKTSQHAAPIKGRIMTLAGPDRLFLGNLIMAAVAINRSTAEPIVRRLIELLDDKDASRRFRDILEINT